MLLLIRSINELLRFSGNGHLGWEQKKVHCLRKDIIIYFKETTRGEWIAANCALEIIIFRYFAFFLSRITFLFFTSYTFYVSFVHDFFRYVLAYRAYRKLRPWLRKSEVGIEDPPRLSYVPGSEIVASAESRKCVHEKNKKQKTKNREETR